MADRFEKVFSLEAPLYAAGCPVIISAGALLKDNQSGNVLAQIKLQNISGQTIKAVTVNITAMDTAGRVVSEGIMHEYLDLTAKRDDTFGQKEAVFLPANARGFTLFVTECVLEGGSVWNSQGQAWSLIPKQNSIKNYLNNDDDLVEQYRMNICSKAEYEMVEAEGIWLCACGAVNASSETVCHSCGTPVETFRNFDIDALVKRKDARLSTEQTAASKKNATKAIALGGALVALVVFALWMGIMSRNSSLEDSAGQDAIVMEHVVESVSFTDYLHWIEDESTLESGMRSFYDSTGILPYLYLADNLYGKNNFTENELDDIAKRLYDELFTDADGQVDENRVLVFILDRGGDGFFTGNVIGSQAFSFIGEEAGDILLENFDLDSFAHAKSKSQYFATAFKKAGEEIGDRRNNTDASNGSAGDVQGENYGTLKLLEDLNIRTGPGTNYNTTGVLKKGNTAKYYEVKSAGGYTWYRIGDNSWIANDGTWLEVDGVAPVSNQAAPNEEIIQEKALQMIKDYAKITESHADSEFWWDVYETDSNTYHVSYENNPFVGLVVISAEVVYDPKTDKLEGTITEDNRATYDPDRDYSGEFWASLDDPVEMTVYTGQDAEVLEAVKNSLPWYEQYIKTNFPNGPTKGYAYDWYVFSTGPNTWNVGFGTHGLTSAANTYECKVEWDGYGYKITTLQDNHSE